MNIDFITFPKKISKIPKQIFRFATPFDIMVAREGIKTVELKNLSRDSTG